MPHPSGLISVVTVDIDKQVEQSGMSEMEKKLDNLRRGGATDAQIAHAEEQLKKLESASDKAIAPGGAKLIQAGSAEAQRLRYEQLTAGMGRMNKDVFQKQQIDLAKQQLDVQTDTKKAIESLQQPAYIDF